MEPIANEGVDTVMGLYETPSLPLHYVAMDFLGRRWLVPTLATGYTQRTPYRGSYTLTRLPPHQERIQIATLAPREEE